MNNYVIYEEVGKGSYSTVHKGRKKRSVEFVTLKSFSKHRKERVLNEVKILSILQHDSILRFHNWYETRNHFWTIYDYLSGCDMKSMIALDQTMQESMIKQIAKMLVDGLVYMHSKGVVYCDFKLSNFVFDEYSNIKYVDFGNARLVREVVEEEINCGVDFMAPELFVENSIHNFKSDIWGLGVLFYRLATGKGPFTGADFEETGDNILNKEVKYIEGFSEEFNKLVSGMLRKNPAERLNWPDIVSNKWFNLFKSKYVFKIAESFNMKMVRATREDIMRVSMKVQKSINELKEKSDKIQTIQENDESDMSDDDLQESQNQIFDSASEKGKIDNASFDYLTSKEKDHIISKIMKHIWFHSVDKQIYPIIFNDSIEVIKFDNDKCDVDFYTEAQLKNEERAKKQLSNVYVYLGSNTHNAQKKIAVICKLASIVHVKNFANLVTESYFFKRLIKILVQAKTKNLRIILCTLLGSVLRHTTSTGTNIFELGLFDVFKDLVDYDNDLVSRRACAAFGEFLFYFATQNDETDDFQYKLPSWVLPTYLKILKKGTNIVQVNYILKTIENITALSIKTGKEFATLDFALTAVQLLHTSKNNFTKMYALSVLVNICRQNEKVCESLTEKSKINIIFNCLKHKNEKLLANTMNLINLILLTTRNKNNFMNTQLLNILFPKISELFVGDSVLLKAKAVVCLKTLFIVDVEVLNYFFNSKYKLLNNMDKQANKLDISKESVNKSIKGVDNYLRKCMRYFFEFLLMFSNSMINKIKQFLSGSVVIEKNLVIIIHALSHLNTIADTENMRSYAYEDRTINNIFSLCESLISLENENITNICLSLYENLLKNSSTFKSDMGLGEKILPKLALAVQKNDKVEVKFVFFKIFIDIFNVCYDEETENPPDQITELIFNFSLSLIDEKEQQISFFALKLLRSVLERELKEITDTEITKFFEKLENILGSQRKDMINANLFALIFYILANSSGLIFNIYNLDIVDISIDYLKEFGKCEQLEEVFGFLNLFFEILHKLVKTNQITQTFTFKSAKFKFLIEYLVNNITSFHEFNLEDGINILYYIIMVIRNGAENNRIKIMGGININDFDYSKMKGIREVFENKPAALKKIRKLQKIIKL